MCELPPLPDGWEYRLDNNTQRFYFIDHNTQTTQWKHPTTEKVYMQADNPGAFVECPRVQNHFHTIQQQQKPQQQQEPEPETSYVARVTAVVERTRLLQPEIQNFAGGSKDKEYTRLMETLELAILDLDAIDPQGNEAVRSARKAAVLEIQALMHQLEAVGQSQSLQLQIYQPEPPASNQQNDTVSTSDNGNNASDQQPSSTLPDDT